MTSLPNNSNNTGNNTQLSNQVLSANANNGNTGGGEQGTAIGPHVSATGSGLGSKAMMALCFILAVILIGYLASIAFKSLMPSYTPPGKSNDGSIYTATDTYQNKGMAKVEPNRTIIVNFTRKFD